MGYSVTTLARFIRLLRMRLFVALAALLQVARCGHVAVRLPYLNPAGVTYVSGYQGHGAPLSYAAGEAAPLQYAAEPAPLQYGVPAKVEAHHVGYAAAQVPAVAAVPFVKHVPTVSHVPVTRFEHHPAVIEKQVDVLKPAVSTRKVEVRRPAIQKQFYDIEERVIVRPAGSALVELDEPTSKLQKGPAVVQPLAHAATISHAPVLAPAPALAHAIHSTPAPLFFPSSTPAPFISSTPASPTQQEEEAVVIDNAELRNARFRDLQNSNSAIFRQQHQQRQLQQQQQQQLEQQQLLEQQQQLEQQQHLFQQQQFQQQQQQQQLQQQHFQQEQLQQNQAQEQQMQQQQLLQNARFAQNPTPNVVAKSNGAPLETIARLASQEQGPSLVPSLRTSPQEGQVNQNRLIDLLTARGSVTEVGFGREGYAAGPVGDAGQVRARVLSATPAPDDTEPAGEHVSTRRVVVSRPIETLQEYDVVEPATKLERVAIQHPTLIKTARLDHLQVHGSVPVVGKALAPAVAQTAVPVFHKTISPAYAY